MRTLGIIVVSVGTLLCVFAGWIGLLAYGHDNGESLGLGAIAFAIAAVGIVGAGATILRNFRRD
jgi:hypothetical protein